MALLDPAHYDEVPVRDLLEAAAHGSIGGDRRLVRSLLARGEEAAREAVRFASEPGDGRKIDIEPIVVDLLRLYPVPEGLSVLVEYIRRGTDEWDEFDERFDACTMAALPYGQEAADRLLELYGTLEEDVSGDLAFILSELPVRDPRILEILLDRLEYDVSDGAAMLASYGDPAAIEPLRGMLAEIPEDEERLRGDVERAINEIESYEGPIDYAPVTIEDLIEFYPERSLPPFDVLSETERREMLSSPDAGIRAGAAYTYFNHELQADAREALLHAARTDSDPQVRGRAWASLADATAKTGDRAEDAAAVALRDEMIAVVNDTTRDPAERGGAAVGLYGIADQEPAQRAIEALYEEGGPVRAKALEAMWRSLWKPYARFFAPHLQDPDKAVARQALRGAGYFQLTPQVDRIIAYFDRDDEMADLREDALFAYAMAMPGETSRGRVKGMLRKIDDLAKLTYSEYELVMFALDERLQLAGLRPVFAEDADEPAPPAEMSIGASHGAGAGLGTGSAPPASNPRAGPQAGPQAGSKVGRNDPCPCGSGKKYKKCHGA